MKIPRNIVAVVLLVVLCASEVESRRKKNKKHKDPHPPVWKSDSRPEANDNIEAVAEGKPIKLTCPATGHPKPTTSWFKDGEVLDTTRRLKLRKSNLIIKEVEKSDQGNYTCIVANSVGNLEFTYLVDVIVKIWPLEVEGPYNVTVNVGDTAQFMCRVQNDPDAKIQWLKRPDTAPSDSSDKVKTEFVTNPQNPEFLTIPNVSLSHAGKYTCLSGNYFGVKYKEAWLTVIQPETPTTTLVETSPISVLDTDIEGNDMDNTDFGTNRDRGSDRNRDRNRDRDNNGRNEGRRNKNKNKKKNKNNRGNGNRNTPTPEVYVGDNGIPTVKDTVDLNVDDHHRNVYDNNWSPGDTTEGHPGYLDDNGMNNKSGSHGSVRNGDGQAFSVWTIYIIVGAVAGGILLIGLVAIVVALCCQKEENDAYKSTSV